MSTFKIKCPKNSLVFINITRLGPGASIKIYLTSRAFRSDEILNENHSMTIDGMDQRLNATFNYNCSIDEPLVYMSIVSNTLNTSTGKTEFSFELNTVQCMYWQTTTNTWQSDGCLVDAKLSTIHQIHCKCGHLSLFAVKHHKSDYCAVFPDNTPKAPMKSVIWICIFFLLLLCSIMILWAWRSDKFDEKNPKLIYLKNDDFRNPYHYSITVVTGTVRNANTSSHVAIKMHGDQFTPQIIPLFDRGAELFQRGSINTFIIQTKKYCGGIEKITLCNDGHGPHPAWYCEAVIIRDLQRNEEWNFDVNRWFSRSAGDKTFTATINTIAEPEYYNRKRMIRLHWTKLLHNSYSLFGICLRRRCRKLSKVERVYITFASIVIGLMADVLFLSYQQDESQFFRNILMSAVIGICTTFMLRFLLTFLLLKSKNVTKNRHCRLMFQSEAL